MKRHEAVALLKELGSKNLIQLSIVLIEERKPGSYQLCVKGDYDRYKIESFLQNYTLEIEEYPAKGLCIFKP